MSAQEEQNLLKRLRQKSNFGWHAETTISELATDLAMHFDVVLDRRALEEIGLDIDETAASAMIVDPNSPSPLESAMPERWYESHSDRLSGGLQSRGSLTGGRPSIVVDVMLRLRDLDLTLMIQRGQVVITTIEAAEDDPVTRIYDVTPLVNLQPARWNTSIDQTNSFVDYDSLISIIETSVMPDTWEALGGPSTMTNATVRGRNWIVISTTTMTHWKVQSLLDRLNQ